MAVRWLWLALVVGVFGCGARSGAGPRTGADAGPRGIVAAALPYSILDARTGRQVEPNAFWDRVAASQLVCVGEEHDNPHHHWFQLEVVSQLASRKRAPLALGMEMFQRPFQGVLDDYAARRIDAATLRSRAGYAERWGYDYNFYGPTMDVARDAGGALLALNASRELTKAVVRRGLEALSPDEKRQLPELVLDDARHRAWFDATMEELGSGHGHGQAHDAKSEPKPPPAGDAPAASPDKPAMPSMERIYTAQVVWDETMADGAAAWANAHPTGGLVLLAGNGHCHDSAIVGRVKRRGVDAAISIQPVIDTEGRVAATLAKPVNDFLVVMTVPK